MKPSDFTKAQREDLGDKIQIAIANETTIFKVLPNIPPYDTSVYWYIQTLYDQVTNPLRIDNFAPDHNRWNLERPWRITVLDHPERNAFSIPGGHFYITTGFLKALETEHELYYILAFEASMMNEKVLLNRLISEHNTTKLVDIAEGRRVADGTNARTLALAVEDLDFDEGEVLQVDELTADLICETSIYDRRGVLSILDRLQNDDDHQWFRNRYVDGPSRSDYIQNVIAPEGCGNLIQNGGYSRYVLDVLP